MLLFAGDARRASRSCPPLLAFAGGREPHGQVLDAVDAGGPQPFGFASDLQVWHALEQRADHGADLPPGEVGAQAVVRPGPAVTDMRVGRAAQVEPVRLGEAPFVAVG